MRWFSSSICIMLVLMNSLTHIIFFSQILFLLYFTLQVHNTHFIYFLMNITNIFVFFINNFVSLTFFDEYLFDEQFCFFHILWWTTSLLNFLWWTLTWWTIAYSKFVHHNLDFFIKNWNFYELSKHWYSNEHIQTLKITK